MSALEYDATWPRCIRCDCLHRNPGALVERYGLSLCIDQTMCTATIHERMKLPAPTSPKHRAKVNGEKP